MPPFTRCCTIVVEKTFEVHIAHASREYHLRYSHGRCPKIFETIVSKFCLLLGKSVELRSSLTVSFMFRDIYYLEDLMRSGDDVTIWRALLRAFLFIQTKGYFNATYRAY